MNRTRRDEITVKLTPRQANAVLQVIESVDAGAVVDTGFARHVATAQSGARRIEHALALFNGLREQRAEVRDRLMAAAGLSERVDDRLAGR